MSHPSNAHNLCSSQSLQWAILIIPLPVFTPCCPSPLECHLLHEVSPDFSKQMKLLLSLTAPPPPPQVFLQSRCVYFLHLVWCPLGTFLGQIMPSSSGMETLHHSRFCFNVWRRNMESGSRSLKTLFPQLLPLVMYINCRISQKVDATRSKSLGANAPTSWDIQ